MTTRHHQLFWRCAGRRVRRTERSQCNKGCAEWHGLELATSRHSSLPTPRRSLFGSYRVATSSVLDQSDLGLVGLGVGKRMLPRPADGAPSPWLVLQRQFRIGRLTTW